MQENWRIEMRFNKGDKVKIDDSTVIPTIQEMLKDKVGIVVAVNVTNWDYHVKFKGSGRPGDLFGFDHSQLIALEN
ncbi:MAG: hypothetical protein HMLIMOIP_002070 [Candidatus Nitrosomirales archaeon]|jgi:hypothetical protein